MSATPAAVVPALAKNCPNLAKFLNSAPGLIFPELATLAPSLAQKSKLTDPSSKPTRPPEKNPVLHLGFLLKEARSVLTCLLIERGVPSPLNV